MRKKRELKKEYNTYGYEKKKVNKIYFYAPKCYLWKNAPYPVCFYIIILAFQPI